MSERSYHGATSCSKGKERNVLFNDALNTFYICLYGVGHMVNDHEDCERKPMLLFPIKDNTYHSLCYTSRGALAGMRNSKMGGYCKYRYLVLWLL